MQSNQERPRDPEWPKRPAQEQPREPNEEQEPISEASVTEEPQQPQTELPSVMEPDETTEPELGTDSGTSEEADLTGMEDRDQEPEDDESSVDPYEENL